MSRDPHHHPYPKGHHRLGCDILRAIFYFSELPCMYASGCWWFRSLASTRGVAGYHHLTRTSSTVSDPSACLPWEQEHYTIAMTSRWPAGKEPFLFHLSACQDWPTRTSVAEDDASMGRKSFLEPFHCTPDLSLSSSRTWHCWDLSRANCNLSPVPAWDPHTASPHTSLLSQSKAAVSRRQLLRQFSDNSIQMEFENLFLHSFFLPWSTLHFCSHCWHSAKWRMVFFSSGKQKEKQK